MLTRTRRRGWPAAAGIVLAVLVSGGGDPSRAEGVPTLNLGHVGHDHQIALYVAADAGEALEPAYAAHSAGRHREAASAWAAIGRPYQEAMALADSRDEGDLRAALDIFLGLAAAPMARVVTGRLRALGATHIPRGPRADTQRHPTGLTSRESEVLTLLGEDLTNAEIAERLVVSPKTVDHHVSAILRKLRVKSRAAAAEEARAGLPR